MTDQPDTSTPAVDSDADAYAAGYEYQRQVQEKMLELGGVATPEWFEWCAQMDEWNAAVAAQQDDVG